MSTFNGSGKAADAQDVVLAAGGIKQLRLDRNQADVEMERGRSEAVTSRHRTAPQPGGAPLNKADQVFSTLAARVPRGVAADSVMRKQAPPPATGTYSSVAWLDSHICRAR